MSGKHLLIILISLFLRIPSFAQQADTLSDAYGYINNSESVDYTKIQLPPLSVFLDAANSYADVKYYEYKKEEIEHQLKLVKKDWLNYFKLQANYQYGTNNAYLLDDAQQLPGGGGIASRNTQSWYNVGAVMSIPLDDIFSRKQKTDIVKSQISQVDYELQKTLENRQLIILETYNEVVKHLSILKVKAESIALYDAQMKISENDFVNGRIDIISLSLERARRSAAMVSFQESRAAMHNAVTLLEMLTKIKIIQK